MRPENCTAHLGLQHTSKNTHTLLPYNHKSTHLEEVEDVPESGGVEVSITDAGQVQERHELLYAGRHAAKNVKPWVSRRVTSKQTGD